jgi:hypothetical protein
MPHQSLCKTVKAIRLKLREDKALNLSELSAASGYDRGTLRRMVLPLIHGKMFYTDFRRILRERQDRHEARLVQRLTLDGQPSTVATGRQAESELQSVVDKFRAPKSNRVRRAH